MTIYENRSAEDLLSLAIEREEGKIATNGALCVTTGKRTGRSPKDRFIVRDLKTESTVDWGDVNQPMTPEQMDLLWQDALALYDQGDRFENSFQVGSHPDHHVTVKVLCQYAWHALFCDRLFIPLKNSCQPTEWRLLNVPTFIPSDVKYHLPGTAAIVLDFTHKRVLICGTLYAGEMKKAMFSVLNYLLPERDILPMHCSATTSKKDGSVALYFGLSGTGKTTLSSDPHHYLIGDDEHGWGKDGVFNFEGGCYAKCIDLSEKNEPLIWKAIRKGTVLENVVLTQDGTPDYADASFTQNTRAAYPLDFIPDHTKEPVQPCPKNVIFLACDLYGVLPPVSKLTQEQVVFYFLSGYTALVGSTEVGNACDIQSTFSSCFGAPFFSRPPKVYADLLLKRIQEAGADVYLVSTGWYGGGYCEGGKRFPIQVSRTIIDAITDGLAKSCEYEVIQPLGLHIPKTLGDIPVELLNPRLGWGHSDHYDLAAQKVISLFRDNALKKGIQEPILHSQEK